MFFTLIASLRASACLSSCHAQVECSMLEIYAERIRDLFNPSKTPPVSLLCLFICLFLYIRIFHSCTRFLLVFAVALLTLLFLTPGSVTFGNFPRFLLYASSCSVVLVFSLPLLFLSSLFSEVHRLQRRYHPCLSLFLFFLFLSHARPLAYIPTCNIYVHVCKKTYINPCDREVQVYNFIIILLLVLSSMD